jgi:hypothetical protein
MTEVEAKIEAKKLRLKHELERFPFAKIILKHFINGQLSSKGAEEISRDLIDRCVEVWVGSGFYLEQKTQEKEHLVIWLKVWEYGEAEPDWEKVFESNEAKRF